MSQKITHTRIDSLISKLQKAQLDIDKMRLGDTRAADSDRVRRLRNALGFIDQAIDEISIARPR